MVDNKLCRMLVSFRKGSFYGCSRASPFAEKELPYFKPTKDWEFQVTKSTLKPRVFYGLT